LTDGGRGPLAGTKVIELASIGPGPFAAMMLADLGADVIRVDRLPGSPGPPGTAHLDVSNRGRRSIAVDLKHDQGRATVLRLVEQADALLEGFRPGVTERLGLGPEDCWAVNPRLVYGRMTGWGQDGPNAELVGHDIDYIALSGVLHAIGRAGERPVPPLNLVGDFGGGGMFLAFGVVCGLLEAGRSGRGQVVDAAMVDGAAVLSTMFWALRAMGAHSDVRGTNLLDTGAHFYEVYETADGRHVAVGAIEPQFYAELCRLTGFEADRPDAPPYLDRTSWPERKEAMARLFRTRTRAEWCDLLERSDACVAPVLSFAEAPGHPHLRARGTFVEVDGVVQPAPAPRFSRTPGAIQRPPPAPGEDTDAVLADWLGSSSGEVEALRSAGAVA
jgi:alpha-methylacyl-CoA racemase